LAARNWQLTVAKVPAKKHVFFDANAWSARELESHRF
jgi:hypothetical protein